jgi:hypothetical protein
MTYPNGVALNPRSTHRPGARVHGIVRSLFALMPLVCLAQTPSIGVIEIYGAKSVPRAEILKQLGTKEGGQLPKSKGDVEDRLAEIDNVLAAHLAAACCENGKAILYVGLQERGSPLFEYHAEPAAEDVKAPLPVVAAYGTFLEAARQAGRAGQAGEDLSQGHSLLADPAARYLQLGFVGLADEHKAALQKVIREAAIPEDRAIAAYILGYAKDKASVQNDLQYALRDPDDTVRSNALRAIAAFAVYARKNPESGLRVSPTWIIEMLNSLVWTDRNNAAVALVTLTEARDESTLNQLRERALPSVLEMARWRHLPHALPAFILAGRIAGLSEETVQEAWNKEQREPVLKRAASSGRR